MAECVFCAILRGESPARDLPADLGAAMWRTAQRLAHALHSSGLRCECVNLFLADGEAAFQEVFHVHLHVFPRFAGDGFRLTADWRARERSELDANAATIRRALTEDPTGDS